MDISGKGLPRWSHESPWGKSRLYFPMEDLHCCSGSFFIKKIKNKKEREEKKCEYQFISIDVFERLSSFLGNNLEWFYHKWWGDWNSLVCEITVSVDAFWYEVDWYVSGPMARSQGEDVTIFFCNFLIFSSRREYWGLYCLFLWKAAKPTSDISRLGSLLSLHSDGRSVPQQESEQLSLPLD